MEVTLLIHLKIPIYRLLQHFTTDKEAVQARVNQLVELDENHKKHLIILSRTKARLREYLIKGPVKGIFRKEILS
jgi:hypothetical protein